MRIITVEWKHLDLDGKTCDHCAETGTVLADMVRQLDAECWSRGVEIVFKETLLPAAEIAQANLVLVNGMATKEILPEAKVADSSCCSCSELAGKGKAGRLSGRSGTPQGTIPPQFIREAIRKVARCC